MLHSCLEKTGELDFSIFLTMLHRQMQQEDPKKEILEALRMTDKQKKGYIQASELRAKLTMLGEKLTNKEGKINADFFITVSSWELAELRLLFPPVTDNLAAKTKGSCCVDTGLQQKSITSYYTLFYNNYMDEWFRVIWLFTIAHWIWNETMTLKGWP